MDLCYYNEQILNYYTNIKSNRNDDFPIFAIEHGLSSDDVQELKKLFAVPKRRVESLFDELNDRRFHASADNYERTQEILFDVLKQSTPDSFNKNFQVTNEGIKIINVAGL